MAMPQTYQKVPTEVTAMQFRGNTVECMDVYIWVEKETGHGFNIGGDLIEDYPLNGAAINVDTGQFHIANAGRLYPVRMGDWVVQESPGHFTPMSDEAFQILFTPGTVRDDFQAKAKSIVLDYINIRRADRGLDRITHNDIFLVWFSKTLKNWKALIGSYFESGMYYEITHNGETGQTYIDAYQKRENVTAQELALTKLPGFIG